MTLYLARHGDAVAHGTVDGERPLSDEGTREVERLAAFLARSVQVDRIVHSGKLRAMQTAAIYAKLLTGGVTHEISGITPYDVVEPLCEAVADWTDSVMVVGHNPFMEMAVSKLVTGSITTSVVTFSTATVCCLKPSMGRWHIHWHMRPKMLG